MSQTHGKKSQDLFDSLMASAPEPPAPAAAPQQDQARQTPPAPAKEAPDEPPVPQAPAQAAKPSAGRRRPRKAEPDPAQPPPEPGGKQGFSVLVDRDLQQLMQLAIPALGGPKVGQLMLQAARAHRHHAAALPDLPVAASAEDYYDEADQPPARHPVVLKAYWKVTTKNRVDADAEAAGLDRSAFIGRVLRAHLTIDVVFVPSTALPLLHSAAETKALATALHSAQRPARQLPEAAGHTWIAYDVPAGHPLREALDAARSAMPGCHSATQALLTVLPRPDGE